MDRSQRIVRNRMHPTIYSTYSPGRLHRTAQCWTRFIASHWETPPTPHRLYSHWNHRPGIYPCPLRTVARDTGSGALDRLRSGKVLRCLKQDNGHRAVVSHRSVPRPVLRREEVRR